MKKEPLHEINVQETSSSSSDGNSVQPPSDSVSCPVCQMNILQRNINLHLDACLGNKKAPFPINVKAEGRENSHPYNKQCSSSGQSSFLSSNVNASRKPTKINKVVYYLMKDPDLRKLLKKEGLDMQGDRKKLINRHQRFTILWNSQCDSDNPMTRMQIINKLRREEQNLSEAAVTSSPSTGALLNFDRNTNPDVIETKQKAYIEKNQSHFDTLIRQLKKRKNEEKSHSNDNEECKKHKWCKKPLDLKKSNECDPLEISVHPSEGMNSESCDLTIQTTAKGPSSEIADLELPDKIDNKSTIDGIKPIENNMIRTCSEVSNILSPLKSSTPKLNRLKPNTDAIDSSTNKPLNENSDSDFKEPNITDDDTDSDERITTKRKSKLSLSRRYGAGSTKKTLAQFAKNL